MKFLVLVALLGCSAAAPNKQAPRTIIDTLGELGEQGALDIIELAGLTDQLSGDGPFTAFVPKQAVIDAIDPAVLEDVDAVAQIILYHVLPGSFLSTDGVNEEQVETLQGTPLRLNIYEDVDGETVATVGGAKLDLANVDIEAGNGLVHLLDSINRWGIPQADAVGTVQGLNNPDWSFEAIAYAIEQLGLGAELEAAEDITVLAPVDSDAFSVEAIDELLADPAALEAILRDHVVIGTAYSAGFGSRREFTTLGGNTIVVAWSDDLEYVIEDVDGNRLCDAIEGDIPTLQGSLIILDAPIVL